MALSKTFPYFLHTNIYRERKDMDLSKVWFRDVNFIKLAIDQKKKIKCFMASFLNLCYHNWLDVIKTDILAGVFFICLLIIRFVALPCNQSYCLVCGILIISPELFYHCFIINHQEILSLDLQWVGVLWMFRMISSWLTLRDPRIRPNSK